MSAEAPCNFYVLKGADKGSAPCKELPGKFRKTTFCLALSFTGVLERKCGRLLKFCAVIGSQGPVLAEHGLRYLCKGKINERTSVLA